MENKNVIITGASRGIGFEIAEEFAAAGANLAICATNKNALDEAVKKLARHGVKVFTQTVNVADAGQAENFVNSAIAYLGGVDVLVNNAGVAKDNLIVRMNEADWDTVLDVNLKGSFLMCKYVLKYMMKERKGCIINISSVVGESGNAGQVNYSASKAGLIGLTKSLAKEFASRNIRVNAVAPGFVETEMTSKLEEKVKESVLATIPLKRFAQAKDIAKAVMFLAGGDASYITGQVLAVNGGLYI